MIVFWDWAIKSTAFPTSKFLPQSISICNVFLPGINCDKPYCDFVCWTTTSINVEHIQANLEFMKSIYPKLRRFFSNYLLPELLTKSNWLAYPMIPIHKMTKRLMTMTMTVFIAFAESLHMAQWSLVIRQNAQNEWFHFQCVGLDVEPTGEWFCNECNSVS